MKIKVTFDSPQEKQKVLADLGINENQLERKLLKNIESLASRKAARSTEEGSERLHPLERNFRIRERVAKLREERKKTVEG